MEYANWLMVNESVTNMKPVQLICLWKNYRICKWFGQSMVEEHGQTQNKLYRNEMKSVV